ncbi:Hsp70 family protein [Microbacterium ureisolvens]|uniref:Hsp70 family protein n=1 Tax=Microbacterium ureisolvens TaxID=2781186 RepID=A0ABS7I2V4_9MICO|nr:Hsp70 family protein [Microbacterium ureisolvens]MBW9111999.1 Hsp70 family protein [Microbacterium ureisolvens]
MATVVFVAEDGEMLFGDAAERRGVTQPERLIREFKRSIGDEIPIVVGGHAIPAEQLYARTVADVIEMVAEREGARPEGVILTHPAMWGPHRIGLVRSALEAVGVSDVAFITEPEAAARHYDASRNVDDGQILAVYDLGGGTFDCVVLRKEQASFDLVGEPVGIDNLGGADFDDAVLRHVLRTAEVPADVLQDASPDSRIALSQLRRECVDAKEALSFDSDAVIPVLLPGGRSSVRLTRAEFEGMIDDSLAKTIDALEDALEDAGIEPDQVESILLIGGSSRIPLVTQGLSERFGRPTAIDADPKSSIALGAAHTALIRAADVQLGVSAELAIFEGTPAAAAEIELAASPVERGIPAPIGPVAAASSAPSARHIVAIAGGAVVVAAAIVFGSTLTAGTGALNGFFTVSPEPTPEATTESAPDAGAPDAQPQAPESAAPVTEQPAPRGANPQRKGATPQKKTTTTTTTTADAAPAPRPTKGASPAPSTGTSSTGDSGSTGTGDSGGTGGTGTTDPGTTDPGTTDPGTTDPGTTDPGTTDPGTTDPGTTDPGTTDPGTTDPGTTDPGTTDPGTTDPGTTDPGTTDPGTTDPGTTDPGTTDPGTTDPGTQTPPADSPPPAEPAPTPTQEPLP